MGVCAQPFHAFLVQRVMVQRVRERNAGKSAHREGGSVCAREEEGEEKRVRMRVDDGLGGVHARVRACKVLEMLTAIVLTLKVS